MEDQFSASGSPFGREVRIQRRSEGQCREPRRSSGVSSGRTCRIRMEVASGRASAPRALAPEAGIWSTWDAGPEPCTITARCSSFLGGLVIQRLSWWSLQTSAKCPISTIKDISIPFEVFKFFRSKFCLMYSFSLLKFLRSLSVKRALRL